eukprot:Clim_evm60s146 gene=Clim_evmTU60s146
MFAYVFVVLAITCAYVQFQKVKKLRQTAAASEARYHAFERLYLIPYVLAVGADWLQGPYVYALYADYGITDADIKLLFVVGFGSSLVFGTFTGSLADKYGRKNMCMVYCITYAVSCATKHFNHLEILMAGRLLAGIATSILFSAFESWLVHEHGAQDFGKDTLSHTFAKASLLNSLTAIVCGVAANLAVETFSSKVAPFDMAAIILGILMYMISTKWTENYGETSFDVQTMMKHALDCIRRDRRVLLLGVVQSMFEGGMYIFVLLWTPAFNSYDGDVPHGYIFASFMIACMIGSGVFEYLVDQHRKPEDFMRYVFAVSGLCLYLPAITSNPLILLVCFCIFEACVGMFWPALSTLRSIYVPEATRSTVMTYFRVPLNMIVVVVMLQDWELSSYWIVCAIFMATCAICMHILLTMIAGVGNEMHDTEEAVELAEAHKTLEDIAPPAE